MLTFSAGSKVSPLHGEHPLRRVDACVIDEHVYLRAGSASRRSSPPRSRPSETSSCSDVTSRPPFRSSRVASSPFSGLRVPSTTLHPRFGQPAARFEADAAVTARYERRARSIPPPSFAATGP